VPSPTQRALAELRDRGFIAAVVENWNAHTCHRHDLFGIIDVLGVGRAGTVAVQACSGEGGDHAARVRKIRESDSLPYLLAAKWRVVVWSWAKRGARGEQKKWTMRETVISEVE
jgi:hypothetical protein